MLIPGDDLNYNERKQVLAAFVHRWTHENAKQTYQGRCPGCVQHFGKQDAAKEVNGVPWHEYHVPLVSDDEWVRAHAFYFLKDGSRLMATRHHAEPAYLAERGQG